MDVGRAEYMAILGRYALEDLLLHPISARQFGRYVKAAETTLHDLFVNDVLGDYSPCFTDVMLLDLSAPFDTVDHDIALTLLLTLAL